MQYRAAIGKSCDGGTITEPDFHFGNRPDGGTVWNEPTVQLQAGGSTAPGVSVTYRATSECQQDAADLAQVIWTRQGEPAITNRQPSMLVATLTGQSRLPEAVPEPLNFTIVGTALPSANDFRGLGNRGTATFQVTDVVLYEVVDPTPGQSCKGPDAGVFSPCDHSNPLSDCYHFAWADGGVPNDSAPHTIPFSTDGGIGSKVLGRIVFGPNSHPGPNAKCVYAVMDTTDPYHPTIISRIQGTAN
jgi:hypothetical protein